MLQDYLSLIGQSFIAPRKAARRVLSPQPNFNTALLCGVAAGCLYVFGISLLEIIFQSNVLERLGEWRDWALERSKEAVAAGRMAEVPQLPELPSEHLPLLRRAMLDVLTNLVVITIGATIAYWVGRPIGGKGDFAAIATVFGAWLLACDTPASLLSTVFILSASPEMMLWAFSAMMALQLLALYLLTIFIAEAHQFASADRSFLQLLLIVFGIKLLYLAFLAYALPS